MVLSNLDIVAVANLYPYVLYLHDRGPIEATQSIAGAGTLEAFRWDGVKGRPYVSRRVTSRDCVTTSLDAYVSNRHDVDLDALPICMHIELLRPLTSTPIELESYLAPYMARNAGSSCDFHSPSNVHSDLAR